MKRSALSQAAKRVFGLVVALSWVFLSSCVSASRDSLVVVTCEAESVSPVRGSATQLRVTTIEEGSTAQSGALLFPTTSAAPLSFPATFSLRFPASSAKRVSIRAEALNTNGDLIQLIQSEQFELRPGESTPLRICFGACPALPIDAGVEDGSSGDGRARDVANDGTSSDGSIVDGALQDSSRDGTIDASSDAARDAAIDASIDARVIDASPPDANMSSCASECAGRVCGTQPSGCDCGGCTDQINEQWCYQQYCSQARCTNKWCCLPEGSSCFSMGDLLFRMCCPGTYCLSGRCSP